MDRVSKRSCAKNFILPFLVLFLFSTINALAAAKDHRKGYLGVYLERITKKEKKDLGISHGVRVDDVVEGSPADKAGIEEDDIILFFDGKKIESVDDLIEKVRATRPGKEVRVTILRDDKRKDLNVKVGRQRSISLSLGLGDCDKDIVLSGFGGGYLGVCLYRVTEGLSEYFGVEEDGGALILKVEDDSPAEEAGLKEGDVIINIEDEEVSTPEDVYDIISDFEEGDKVELTIIRHGDKKKIVVELGEGMGSSIIRILKRGSRFYPLISPGIYHPDFEIEIKKIPKERYDHLIIEKYMDKMGKLEDIIERKIKRRKCDLIEVIDT